MEILPLLSVTIKEELGNWRQGWHLSFLIAKCASNAECVVCAQFRAELPDGTATFPDTPPGLYSFQPYMGLTRCPGFLSAGNPPSPGESSNIQPLVTNTLDDFLLTQDHFSSGLSSSSSLKAAVTVLWPLWILLPEVSVSSLHSGVLSLVLGGENRSNISEACRSPPCQSNSCLCLSKVYFTAL